jgi:protein-disulfide isomerase
VSSNGSVSGRLARVGALLERCVTAVTGIAAAAFLWLVVAPALWPTERKEALTALASVRLPLTGSALRGSANAKVALVEFSDFQCPFCVKFEQEIMPTLSREYIETGKVLLVFRHYPQSTLHPQAFAAAEFAECAGRQGQFWPFHSLLTASRGNLETESLWHYSQLTKLDRAQLKDCLGGSSAAAVRRDIESANSLGFTGTPSFVFARVSASGTLQGVAQMIGARPIQEFRKALDAILAGVR